MILAAYLDIGRASILAVQNEVEIEELEEQIQEKIAIEELAMRRLLT
jgi:hypothetical protein